MFHRFFPCSQSLERRGKRLYATKAQRIVPAYADDTSLHVEVGRSRPRATVELEGVPDSLYLGEEVEGIIRATNTGRLAVDGVQLFTSEMGMIRLKHPDGK